MSEENHLNDECDGKDENKKNDECEEKDENEENDECEEKDENDDDGTEGFDDDEVNYELESLNESFNYYLNAYITNEYNQCYMRAGDSPSIVKAMWDDEETHNLYKQMCTVDRTKCNYTTFSKYCTSCICTGYNKPLFYCTVTDEKYDLKHAMKQRIKRLTECLYGYEFFKKKTTYYIRQLDRNIYEYAVEFNDFGRAVIISTSCCIGRNIEDSNLYEYTFLGYDVTSVRGHEHYTTQMIMDKIDDEFKNV